MIGYYQEGYLEERSMPVLVVGKEKKEYDFTDKTPSSVLTQDELKHYDEGMSLKNNASPADKVNFQKAVEATIADFDNLFP
jgi:hypothetical protein